MDDASKTEKSEGLREAALYRRLINLGVLLTGGGVAIRVLLAARTGRILGDLLWGAGLFLMGYSLGATRKRKKCPQCGKMVSLFERVCPFCMHLFEQARVEDKTAQPGRPEAMRG